MLHYAKARNGVMNGYSVAMIRKYDLEDRTFAFAHNVRSMLRKLQSQFEIAGDCNQLKRSSGSVGANYIEANEALSKKDFLNRIKICRKEAKESRYWLKLIIGQLPQEYSAHCATLMQEAHELQLIFGSIIQKLEH